MRVSPVVRVGGVLVASIGIAVAGLLHAPVSSADDLRQQVADAETQLQNYEMKAEAALQDLQGAKLHLSEVNDKLARTQQKVDEAQAEVTATQQDIGKFAANAYRTGGVDPNLQIFLADDPQQFLDQATILNILADNQSASLRRGQTASLRLAQATAELSQQQADAEATKTDMAQRKKDSDQAYADMQTYLNGLQSDLRAQIAAERQAAAEEAARQAAAAEAARQAELEAARQQQQQQQNSGNGNGNGNSNGNGGGGGGGGTDWTGNTVGSDRASIAVQAALDQLGDPYDPTGNGTPPTSWDCSKLTAWAWGQAGVQLTALSYTQATEVQRVDISQLQPGDLLFYLNDGAHHVAMYIGGGQIIEASSPETGVRISTLHNSWNDTYFTMAGRPYS